MKKLQQESSDTEDFLFTHKIEYSRYSNDFEELEEIGGGSFGRVYKCKHILATGASIDNLYIIKYHNA